MQTATLLQIDTFVVLSAVALGLTFAVLVWAFISNAR